MKTAETRESFDVFLKRFKEKSITSKSINETRPESRIHNYASEFCDYYADNGQIIRFIFWSGIEALTR